MPRSFLIKNRARLSRTAGRIEAPRREDKDAANTNNQQNGAVDITGELTEPLDLMVKSDKVNRNQNLDTDNPGPVSDERYVEPESRPTDLECLEAQQRHTTDPPFHGPNVEYGAYQLSPTPAASFQTCRHFALTHSDEGRPSLVTQDRPDVGYFSRFLLAYKFREMRGLTTGRKRHLCRFCPKAFNDKFDLKRHIRTHTGVRPFKCERCFRAFTQRCSLEVHQRKVHNVEVNYAFKERRGKVYICEDCGYSTNDLNDHYTHSVQVHKGLRHEPSGAPGPCQQMSCPEYLTERPGGGIGFLQTPGPPSGVMQEFAGHWS